SNSDNPPAKAPRRQVRKLFLPLRLGALAGDIPSYFFAYFAFSAINFLLGPFSEGRDQSRPYLVTLVISVVNSSYSVAALPHWDLRG
ncbi:MAG: hypothetical protein ACREQ2_21100, partial [Candidatus Binatia bacterium]